MALQSTRRSPYVLRKLRVALRKRSRLIRWWTSPAFGKVELTPVTLLVVAVLLIWTGRTIWGHPGERTAGTEIALQILAALVAGPLLVAHLLPKRTAAAAAQKRIWLSNFVRFPLRERRTTRSVGAWLLAAGFEFALLPTTWPGSGPWADDAAVLLWIASAAMITIAWVGFVLPRRYTVRLPQSTPVLQPSQQLEKEKAEALAGAFSLVCVMASLILQFLRLYAKECNSETPSSATICSLAVAHQK